MRKPFILIKPIRLLEKNKMSHWVYLVDEEGKSVIVPDFSEGGTRSIGVIGTTIVGTSNAELNITYNYSKFYYQIFGEGLRFLDGKKAKDVQEKLMLAVTILGTEQDSDYWKATKGNAGFALSILLKWAKLHPNATFEVH